MNRRSEKHRITIFALASAVFACLAAGCGNSSGGTAPESAIAGQTAENTAASAASEEGTFSFRILNTGKSDCTVFVSGSTAILLDTADADDYNHIKEVLDTQGVQYIKAILLSHYDKDHIGSAALILQNYPVGEVYGPEHTEDSDTYNEMYKALTKTGVPFTKLSAGKKTELTLGEGSFSLSAPEEPAYEDDNDYTVIVTVSCGGENCLFLGDALKTRMKEFMDEKLESYALVKTPHHGDYYKAFKEFTEETAFDYAVICAEENGDTIEEKLLQALNDAGAQTFFTYNGDISASFSPLALSQTP